MNEPDCITVLVVWSSGPRQIEQQELRLPRGGDVRSALAACRFVAGLSAPPVFGIRGRKVTLDEPLQDGDRVEIYRPLRVDPKRARRERFAGQGAGPAGLFARRRLGTKPGS